MVITTAYEEAETGGSLDSSLLGKFQASERTLILKRCIVSEE